MAPLQLLARHLVLQRAEPNKIELFASEQPLLPIPHIGSDGLNRTLYNWYSFRVPLFGYNSRSDDIPPARSSGVSHSKTGR